MTVIAAQNVPIRLSPSAFADRDIGSSAADSNGRLIPIGTTYSMAQEVRWIDENSFAIGRWDGTLTIFRLPKPPSTAPEIRSAVVSPVSTGIEMIVSLNAHMFVSSLKQNSIALWESAATKFSSDPLGEFTYNSEVGVANSGTLVDTEEGRFLVTGHAAGYILIWRVLDTIPFLQLISPTLVRSPNPVPSPYQLWNVREIVPVAAGRVLFGSEDGDICMLNVPDGAILSRTRYNPSAQRGINDLSALEDYLVVANCSVGQDDSNLWLYRIHDTAIELVDRRNLKVDAQAPQAFNFCVELANTNNGLVYIAATEEGLLWVGDVTDAHLGDPTSVSVSSHFGAALNVEPKRKLLAVAGDNIHLFQFTDTPKPV